tara:strand:- start:429 stop:611 length:183 start_codon:yes stop_codon:yes gene_type:complete
MLFKLKNKIKDQAASLKKIFQSKENKTLDNPQSADSRDSTEPKLQKNSKKTEEFSDWKAL